MSQNVFCHCFTVWVNHKHQLVFLALSRNKFNCEVLLDIAVHHVILGFKLSCCRHNFGDAERHFLWIHLWYESDIGWSTPTGCLVLRLDSSVHICVMGTTNRSPGHYIHHTLPIFLFSYVCLLTFQKPNWFKLNIITQLHTFQ